MKIVRAAAMGMCFGVRDALVATQAISNPEQVTIHGQLVHNPDVNSQLALRGFQASPEDQRETLPQTPRVLITAHGISDIERERLRSAGKELIDTTCPLVRRVHAAALQFQDEGRHVLVIGKPGHVEVQGIIGDLLSCDVIGGLEDVREYESRRLGIVCQTTVAPDLADAIHAEIRRRNPRADIVWTDTICQPTRQRQLAMLDLIQRVDMVVVVGGRNSNNTRQLVRLCEQRQVPVVHVERADELEPASFDGVEVVGLTAGTSTLDKTIDEVHGALARIGASRREAGNASAGTVAGD